MEIFGPEIIAAIIISVSAIISGFVSLGWREFKEKINRERLDKIKTKVHAIYGEEKIGIEDDLTIKVNKSGEHFSKTSVGDIGQLNGWIEGSVSNLEESVMKEILARVSALPNLSEDQVSQIVEGRFNELNNNISQIKESLLPENKDLTNSSINQTLLSYKVDEMSKRLEGLEKQLLTRWDVFITLCFIIGGASAVGGTTFAILKIFGKVS